MNEFEKYGGAIKTSTCWALDENRTNSIGFAALPGGYRNSNHTYQPNLSFRSLLYVGQWWLSREENSAGYCFMLSYVGVPQLYSYAKFAGFSVRCIKD